MFLKLKKAVFLLLAICMVFSVTAISTSYETVEARSIMEIENELKEYKNLLAKLQSELADITANITDLEGKSGQTAELMAQYQAEIDLLESEIAINSAIMESYDVKRAEVLTEMAIVQEDYEYRVSMYKNLMQFIYENSETNAFELLFSSENFSEYLSQRDNFNDIMAAANVLIKDIEVSIADLETLDAELAETQGKYSEYVKELNRSQSELQTKIEEFKTIAGELNLNVEELSEEYKNKNATVKEIKEKIAALEKERKQYYDTTADFLWPIESGWRISSRFGYRGNPFGGSSTEYHKGIDFAAPRGTPIRAVRDGVVQRASYNGGYGECVIIYHGDGLSTLYAHCDNTSKTRPVYEVKVGESVKRGQVIAYVGTTGRSTGYHLHFGVIDTNTYSSLSGNYVNPEKYLPKG